MTFAAWICSAVTIVSALVSLGYSVAGLRSAPTAGKLSSEYTLARSAALVVIAVIAPFTNNNGFIAAAAVAMVCVQGLDTVVGARLRDHLKTFGPLGTAAINAAALLWLIISA